MQDRLAEAVGSDDPRRADLYWIMLMLGVHDFAVLRAVLGEPAEVTGTDLLGERHLVTTLRYESSGPALLELGVWPHQTWTDTSFEVMTDTSLVTLSFPNPWVRYLPTTLVRRSAEEDGTLEIRAPESYRYASPRMARVPRRNRERPRAEELPLLTVADVELIVRNREGYLQSQLRKGWSPHDVQVGIVGCGRIVEEAHARRHALATQ